MKKQGNMTQLRELSNSPDPTDKEVYQLSHKEFKITVREMLNDLSTMILEEYENITRERICIFKLEVKNTITELKN